MTTPVYELKDKSVCPPGGFVFQRKDGSKYEGTYAPDAVHECGRHHGIHETEAWQKVLHETYSNMLPEAREYFITKSTQSLLSQNPTFRYIDKKLLLPCPWAYNPSLITVDGDDWLVYRRQVENSDSTVCRMNFRTRENHTIELHPLLYHNEQFEDPRVWWHDGAIHLLVCSWRKNWNYKPILRAFRLNSKWEIEKEFPLTYGGNGKGVTQKNWVFFSHEGEQHFVYQYAPFQVVKDDKLFSGKSLTWKYGEIRGGTPPVRVGDHYYTFFHSRLDHGRSKYYAGCLAFEARAPFHPVAMTREPLLVATNREPNLSWAPLVVFPCGALYRNETWTVSLGINDTNCGLVDWTMAELKALMSPT